MAGVDVASSRGDERRLLLRASTLVPLATLALGGHAAPTMNTYRWLPTECAPTRYPMRVLRGAVQLADGSSEEFPQRRNVNNGWGKRGSTRIVGPENKAVPVTVLLRWFSWSENAFFEGKFELPADKLAGYFANPLPRARMVAKPEPFTRLIVGMAPGGFVAAWLDAGGEVVEVGTYQGARVDRPWTEVSSNTELSREAYIEDVLRERLAPDELALLRQSGAPAGLYRTYHQRYRWGPRVKLSGQPLYMNFDSFNGESARWWADGGPVVKCETRPVPSVVEVAWTPPGNPSVRAIVTLDEGEALAAFRKLSQADPARELTLNIRPGTGGAALSLEDGQNLLPFKLARSELVSL